MNLHETIAGSHPKLARGQVWCTTCARTEKLQSADALAHGWPKCCGHTMTIDPPWERAGLPDPNRYALEIGRAFYPDHHYVWRDATGPRTYAGEWAVLAPGEQPRPCRWGRPSCKRPSVVRLLRGTGRGRSWWHYCEEHLYGRVLAGGTLWDLILEKDG